MYDSIVKAIQSLDKLKELQYFATWITRIIINTCKDNLRKAKNARPHDITEFENKLVHHGNINIEENMGLYSALDNLKKIKGN